MSLGKLFEMSNGVIIPKEDCYNIEPIKAALDAYFQQYPRLVPYLHYMKSMCKEDNPYADVDVNQREEQIIFDLKLPFDSSDPLIQDALNCVEEKYSTTFYRLYRGIKSMMDKIAEKLMTEEIDFKAREGNAGNILKLMEKYEALRKSFKQAYKDFEEEQGQISFRGGGSASPDEDLDY